MAESNLYPDKTVKKLEKNISEITNKNVEPGVSVVFSKL